MTVNQQLSVTVNQQLSVTVNQMGNKTRELSVTAKPNCHKCNNKNRELSAVMHVALAASTSEQRRSQRSVARASGGRGEFVV